MSNFLSSWALKCLCFAKVYRHVEKVFEFILQSNEIKKTHMSTSFCVFEVYQNVNVTVRTCFTTKA